MASPTSRLVPALKTVKACVYDNPATMAREAWMDGRLRAKIEASVLLGKHFRGGRWFPFYLNVGHWEMGRVWGDKEAIG